MTILRVTGQLVVRVDDVDVEQVSIEHPAMVEGFPVALRAMTAALLKEDVQALQRQMRKCTHTLEYDKAEFAKDSWLVTFNIRAAKLYEAESDKAEASNEN